MAPDRPPVAPDEEVDNLARAYPQLPAAVERIDEWDRRALCLDGNCLGLIGEDGRCGVCGRDATGEAKASPASVAMGDEPGRVDGVQANAKHDDAWSQRRLCGDGACLGVIGENGLCGVCGKGP